ncbi:MAG TPA: hypothetical protein VN228_12660 [Pyrinomonadaceae bacterium]|nr:hypothetical protein [Pyrinomonadaceae bacterium]
MLKNRQVRVIKRDQREPAGANPVAPGEPQPAASEREVKTVVSGWVNEHRRRADEFRRNYADLLKGVGFSAALPSARG